MSTVQVKNPRAAEVEDYSDAKTREAIVAANKQQVRREEVTLIRRIMRGKKHKSR